MSQEMAGQVNASAPDSADEVPPFVRRLSWILDDAVPITDNRRVGVDGVLSMLPVVGDGVGFVLSSVIVLSAVQAGCSWPVIARMVGRNLVESAAGSIPLVGPVIAFAWRTNARNLSLIEAHLADPRSTRRRSMAWLLVSAIGLALIGALFVGLVLMLAYLLLKAL